MYDIIIAGGGPSGGSAARRAAKNGLRTLLLEKEVLPRHKPCGGAVSEHALSFLDFPIPLEISEEDIFGVKVSYKGRSIVSRKSYRLAITVTRSRFDYLLLQKAEEAGAIVVDGMAVTDYKEDSDGVSVRAGGREYRARYLITAEGAHGSLKRRVRRPDTKKEYAIAVERGVAEDTGVDIVKESKDLIELDFSAVRNGYGWVFPHNGYYSVGVGGVAKYMTKPKLALARFLSNKGFVVDDGARPLKTIYKQAGHMIPVGGIERRVGSGRVLLAGDAAGFVDAFTGEGIAYAIRSGQIAADMVSGNFLNGWGGAQMDAAYKSACKSEFNDNLRYALILSRLMHYFPEIFFSIMIEHASLVSRMMDIPASRSTYKDFLLWLLPRIPKFYLNTPR